MRRREGGREGEVIPRVWENTVATEGMLGNLNPLGDGPGRSLADHGARVPEVLPAAELEGFLTGLIIAMPRVQIVPPGGTIRHLTVSQTSRGAGCQPATRLLPTVIGPGR